MIKFLSIDMKVIKFNEFRKERIREGLINFTGHARAGARARIIKDSRTLWRLLR